MCKIDDILQLRSPADGAGELEASRGCLGVVMLAVPLHLLQLRLLLRRLRLRLLCLESASHFQALYLKLFSTGIPILKIICLLHSVSALLSIESSGHNKRRFGLVDQVLR